MYKCFLNTQYFFSLYLYMEKYKVTKPFYKLSEAKNYEAGQEIELSKDDAESMKDYIDFGKYLLSDKRTERIKATKSEIPVKDRLKEVYHADVENFKK